MIIFQMHIMWYESAMLNETFDSIHSAMQYANNVKVKLCFNSQTYIEKPLKGSAIEMFDVIKDHPLMAVAEVVHKTDSNEFYNIADWRREQYDVNAKYTIWGESDALVSRDFFYILENIEINESHLMTFSSRPMWDNSWDIVTHKKLQGYSKPCQCGDNHRDDCIELLESPWKYKDYITQEQLDEFNDEEDIDIVKLDGHKIDGSLLCLSSNLPTPFIAPDMHFVREDTCASIFFQSKKIPQYHVTNRLKGHNYWHPNKRTNTDATRNDDIFKQYANKSQESMEKFLTKNNQVMENIWFDRLEDQLKTVTVYDNPRARKRMWEEMVVNNTIDKGIILEFGVGDLAGSIEWFPKYYPNVPVYGFDSFEGLPEAWDLGAHVIPKGHFSTNGVVPKSEFKEISFVKGLFNDTLPEFLTTHKDEKIKIIHLDADLYSSTKYVLDQIYDHLSIGTIILFDELTHFPEHPEYVHNRQHEYKAFKEFCEKYPKFDFEVLGRTTICQVAMKVISI